MKKSELLKLKKETKHYKEKAEQYRNYSYSLKRQLDESIKALKNLGVGFIDAGISETYNNQLKFQITASNRFVDICSKLPKEPEGFFYI